MNSKRHIFIVSYYHTRCQQNARDHLSVDKLELPMRSFDHCQATRIVRSKRVGDRQTLIKKKKNVFFL